MGAIEATMQVEYWPHYSTGNEEGRMCSIWGKNQQGLLMDKISGTGKEKSLQLEILGMLY